MTSSIQTITVETLPIIAYQGVRVLTTELLAQLYGTDDKNIRMNFSNNAARFVSGKHFFKLEGEELRQFKDLHRANDIGSVEISRQARALTLWTERGAARHAKILDTDAAWDVFEQLENAYFNPRESAPKTADPIIGALVHGLMEIDAIKQQNTQIIQVQTDINRKTEILENRVQNVELQHRNGVPEGYLSKSQAHHLYGRGLSEDVFHRAMKKIGVAFKKYIHRGEDGHDVSTQAYLEGEIEPAVALFLSDAKQATAQMCESPMLDGRRFRYVKATDGQGEPA